MKNNGFVDENIYNTALKGNDHKIKDTVNTLRFVGTLPL